MCKYNYKKDDDEEKGKGKGKEKGKVKVIFQKIKEKIKYMDRNDIIMMIVPVLLLVLLLGPYARTNKKAVDIKVQNQILSKEQLNKNTEVPMNGTSKLNEENFEVFVSKKVPNRGLILVKSTDFIKNNSNILFYKATKHIIISGNPEIIEKLKLNISNNSNINLKKNSIKIKLDSNRQNNSTLKLNINHDVLTKDELVNDETLLTIEYEESYAD